MIRKIHENLLFWKGNINRKVLLLRGARQVGKTWSARHLGKEFDYFLEINFEFDREVHAFFESSLDPDDLILNLSAYYKIPIEEGKTLLFLDEIQACVSAISSLRFFYERKPNLHVLAAGSLLEFALEELPSFGVGRIESLWMYPMSFDEFLLAKGEERLLEIKAAASPSKPLHAAFHQKLLTYLRQFMILGGLPEVVKTFIQTNNFEPAFRLLDQLIVGLDDDFTKYKKHVSVFLLRTIFESVVHQTGNKFILSHAAQEANHLQIKEALQLLEKAGLIYRVYHSAGNGIPLGGEVNLRKFKFMLFDHGMFQRILGLKISQLLIPTDYTSIFKGNLAELFAALELIKYEDPFRRAQLFYWQKEKKSSNAEVDFLLQFNHEVTPLEVKAGTQGKMQSLRLFMEEKRSNLGFRTSMENFGEYDSIQIVPLYGLSYLGDSRVSRKLKEEKV